MGRMQPIEPRSRLTGGICITQSSATCWEKSDLPPRMSLQAEVAGPAAPSSGSASPISAIADFQERTLPLSITNGSGGPRDLYVERGNTRYGTTLIEGNWNSFSGKQDWTIAPTTIPNSLFLSSKPAWFGDLAWPPIDPTKPVTNDPTIIPAGYRFIHGVDPRELLTVLERHDRAAASSLWSAGTAAGQRPARKNLGTCSLPQASPTGSSNAPERLTYRDGLEEFRCAAVGRWIRSHVVRRENKPATTRCVVVHQ